MSTCTQLYQQASALPVEEQRALLKLIAANLADVEERADAAWAEELNRRIDAYERGEASAKDWRESLDWARQQLEERIQSRV